MLADNGVVYLVAPPRCGSLEAFVRSARQEFLVSDRGDSYDETVRAHFGGSGQKGFTHMFPNLLSLRRAERKVGSAGS